MAKLRDIKNPKELSEKLDLILNKDEKLISGSFNWSECLDILKDESLKSCHFKVLKYMRILSRDRKNLQNFISESEKGEKNVDILKRTLGNHSSLLRNSEPEDEESVLEAHRVINNCLLQNPTFQDVFSNDQEILLGSTRLLSTQQLPVLNAALRNFFLVTAFNQPVRRKLSAEPFMAIGTLEGLLNKVVASRDLKAFTAEEKDLIGNIMRALFNITLVGKEDFQNDPAQFSPQNLQSLKNISGHVRTMFEIQSLQEVDLKDELLSNAINLLTNIPNLCTDNLFVLSKSNKIVEVQFYNESMVVPYGILNYVLVHTEDHVSVLEKVMSPSLLVLCQMSRSYRNVRRYLRSIVLPPLRDVQTRPEVGESPRNKFCKLLTSPITSISTMVAEFLFILCKERVTRMVKYTGYGNAAGLLARRGLMGRQSGDNASDFSDDDEDSDTEEYCQNVHRMNPIMGCVEKEHPSPFEGMSEEQKEYEAMKLVGLIDQLNQAGIIKPGALGPDGKPVAVKHILQLTENIQLNSQNEDNDE